MCTMYKGSLCTETRRDWDIPGQLDFKSKQKFDSQKYLQEDNNFFSMFLLRERLLKYLSAKRMMNAMMNKSLSSTGGGGAHL